MKLYIKSSSYTPYDTLIATCGEYELRKDRIGKYFVQGPDGFVNFNGNEHPDIPDDVYKKFSKYVPTSGSRSTIKASDHGVEYIDEEYNITQNDWDVITANPTMYGYHVHSTMTDMDIMFVSERSHVVKKYGSTVAKMLMDSDDQYIDFCETHGLEIFDDEQGDLFYINSQRTWCVERNGDVYIVEVVGKDSARF